MPEGTGASFTTDLRQSLMDKSDRHGALPDGRRAAFDRSSPDVAGGEEAGEVCFEGERRSRGLPTSCNVGERIHIATGWDVTGIVNSEICPIDSVCSWLAADADEQ